MVEDNTGYLCYTCASSRFCCEAPSDHQFLITPTTYIMKKDIVRKTYLKKRQELPAAVFEEEESHLIQNTIELIKKFKPACIHCFLPIVLKG